MGGDGIDEILHRRQILPGGRLGFPGQQYGIVYQFFDHIFLSPSSII
jgi:hypothetical protein